MAVLDELLNNDIQVEMYLEDVSTEQFKTDIRELMAEYSDDAVVDKAIELLKSCRLKAE